MYKISSDRRTQRIAVEPLCTGRAQNLCAYNNIENIDCNLQQNANLIDIQENDDDDGLLAVERLLFSILSMTTYLNNIVLLLRNICKRKTPMAIVHLTFNGHYWHITQSIYASFYFMCLYVHGTHNIITYFNGRLENWISGRYVYMCPPHNLWWARWGAFSRWAALSATLIEYEDTSYNV